MTTFGGILGHYVWMASIPGAKAYCWEEVQRLARQHPSEFGELPALLVEAMKGRGREAASS